MHADHHYYYHCCYHSAICGGTSLSLTHTFSSSSLHIRRPTHISLDHVIIVSSWHELQHCQSDDWIDSGSSSLSGTPHRITANFSRLFLSLSVAFRFGFFRSFISFTVFRQFKFWYAKMSGGMRAIERHHCRWTQAVLCCLFDVRCLDSDGRCWNWRN